MIHTLKCWPAYFNRLGTNEKTFEVRRNDRDFQAGDVLDIREYDPTTLGGAYTGRTLSRRVSYVLHGGQFGIKRGYVVMALEEA